MIWSLTTSGHHPQAHAHPPAPPKQATQSSFIHWHSPRTCPKPALFGGLAVSKAGVFVPKGGYSKAVVLKMWAPGQQPGLLEAAQARLPPKPGSFHADMPDLNLAQTQS